MAGYCIELYKFMRVDKNFSKKERLLNFRQQPNNSNTNNTKNESNNDNHIKYHSYGEFDRISFIVNAFSFCAIQYFLYLCKTRKAA